MFCLIACVGKNRELGKGGGLVFRIKEDMKFFRETTRGHKVVMGRGTWDSLPGKLEGRENIVISRHDFPGPDKIIHDVAEFIAENKDSEEEIFVIGGGMVYFEFLKYAKKIYLTEVEKTDAAAEVFFPEFNKTEYVRELIKKGKEDGVVYSINKYSKK